MNTITINNRKIKVKNPKFFVQKLDLPGDSKIYWDENGDCNIQYDITVNVPESLSTGSVGYIQRGIG